MKLTNEIVIHKAKELGFDLVGFARAEKLIDETALLKEWLDRHFQAGMTYMERNLEKRFDINEIFPGAKSVISLALNYYTPEQHSKKNGFGKVSRYGWGKDYHILIWDMLEILEEEFLEIDSNFQAKSYVDTGPVMDKAWAVHSGIGWQGKHSNIISKEIGSWFFIANIITNLEFDYSKPITDHCGTCNLCIEACPTNAIVKPYIVDANKCISFLTIENKNEIANEFENKMDDWVFGCDICQDVCPWNKKFSTTTPREEFFPINKELDLVEVLNLDETQFQNQFEVSPIRRAKLDGLKRNASFLFKREPGRI
jgi:epoxyqueuosine reductase